MSVYSQPHSGETRLTFASMVPSHHLRSVAWRHKCATLRHDDSRATRGMLSKLVISVGNEVLGTGERTMGGPHGLRSVEWSKNQGHAARADNFPDVGTA